ncbi:protein indeterminate-domain 12-like isoform X1 [Olea europaea var. sylvestris]|uniref:protein indeterminate-domain 12-like isoform X1 n=1 Tax=Olea europaea var. sylvestris TaxID=158386 RepID=UPI000C1D4928|nr:protein indeterminate-domain 12-like isoform X1 [Olea europaea var. sylvestris]
MLLIAWQACKQISKFYSPNSDTSNPRVHEFGCSFNPMIQTQSMSTQQPQKIKKKRNLPGNPDPDAEVIALSPKTLLATNRFVCEICSRGFQRDQNLQLHRRGHSLPWKLKQRDCKENKKRVYVCPEPTCVHSHPSRALGDLTGIKKHYCRKHGEKKWKCEKCSKIYAVQSDWKAHSKTCGTREYRCDCGTLFSRKDSFITHRAFCDALAEETARLSAANSILASGQNPNNEQQPPRTAATFHFNHQNPSSLFSFSAQPRHFPNPPPQITALLHPTCDPPQNHYPNNNVQIKPESIHIPLSSPFYQDPLHKGLMTSPFHGLQVSTGGAPLSATALLQKAATVATVHSVGQVSSTMAQLDMGHMNTTDGGFPAGNIVTWQETDRFTRDFLGLKGNHCGGGSNNGSSGDLLSYAGGVEYPTYDREHSLLKHQGGF